MQRPTHAEVDLSAIRENIAAIRARVGPKVKIMPAVKADAYGHGAVEISRACLIAGADALGVACIEEAIELREAGISAPILILGCSEPSTVEYIVSHDIISTCSDIVYAQALSDSAVKQAKKALIHIKVDTGMGRIGVAPEDACDFITAVSSLPSLNIKGVFTHFPSADEQDRSFTLAQIATFRKILSGLNRRDIGNLIVHASNSGGILAFPEADFDAVRPGIMIYGLYPSEEVSRSIPIREALTLKTRIVYLKHAIEGMTISYGRTHILKKNSKIATLPIGYGDGYSRLLSNQGDAVVRGVRVPVIGRVCMDQILIDVTNVPDVSIGDEVVLYGGGYDFLSVSEIANKIGTISYEVLCNIGKRVPRIYMN